MSNTAHRAYRYQPSTHTVKHAVNEYGYVLIALAARNIFPMLGDLQALVVLQTLVHLFLCLFVLYFLLDSTLQKRLFVVLYAINPLILHITTFPFYYFWTVLPSLALAIIWLKPNKIQIWMPILTPIILLSLFIRPTSIFLAAFIYVLAFMINKKNGSRTMVAGSFICFVIGSFMIFNQPTQRSLFHTIYLGIGAYSNPYNIDKLDDTEGFKYYKKIKGVTISTHPIHGNWKKKTVMQDYNQAIKQRYFEIWQQSPVLLLKNAVLNTIQAFSFGYDTKHFWTRLLSMGLGIFVIGLFYSTQQWVWIVSILLSASFTFYFPPVPVYLYGSYLLLTFGFMGALEKIVQRGLWHRIQLFLSSQFKCSTR
ncbi:MAG: hypothetical protein NXI01_03550 [Gammaproteobacteria bacterium]|nr:hypothetical protein [Gammaproteobacteria bacterium]